MVAKTEEKTKMDYKSISGAQIDALWELQTLFKAEIGESKPDCDVRMYQSLGFSIALGNLLAYET